MTRPSPRTLSKRLLLAGLLSLAACGQAPQGSLPPNAPAAPSAPARPALKSLGVFELSVTGATTAAPTATVRPAAGLSAQATEVGGLSFEPVSFGTFTDEAARVRYLRATFRVKNGSGGPLTLPTYVPIDTDGANATVGATPFREVRYFDGSDASDRADDLRVDTARRVNSGTGQIEADPEATPLVSNLDTGDVQGVGLNAGEQLAGIAHEGWQAGPVAADGTQIVTFSTRVPLAPTPARDPFAFKIVFTVLDNPGTRTLTNIAAVQGVTAAGDAASPLNGQTVTVEGVVTQVTPGLSGFFLQEEGLDADRNAATSDGVFVYCNTDCPALSVGERVRVVGNVSEAFGTTQISAGTAAITRLNVTLALPAAQPLTLPLDFTARERYEGMRVSSSGVVTNNFTLGRGSSFDIADARVYNYAQLNAPSVQGYAAYQAEFKNRYIRIDDGSRINNPETVFARGGQPLSAGNTLRGGDTATVTGVLTYSNDGWTGSGSLDTYRIQASSVNVQPANPRLETPEAVGGTLRVGSMNVLNYFTTLVNSNAGCTPNGVGGSAARGANNCTEFERQRDKIVAAITKMDPAVLGLLEIQNDFDKGASSSVANLVTALNAVAGPNTYAYVNPGNKVGTDAISVAMIYQPARVTPVGRLAILDRTVDPRFIDTCNRPTWAQTFQGNDNGGRFTAVMAHLKSKGSACDALGDTDRGDGQGNAYRAREQAASAIVDWLKTNPTGLTETDHLIMGDLNAYAMETAVQNLVAGGYTNLFPNTAYSYQFDGQWGSLDHALASGSLFGQVTGQTKWHINADEPTVLDYNTEFKSAAQLSNFYAPTPFRSSDHDPVLVGLSLTAQTPVAPPAPVASVALTPDTANLTASVGGASVTQSFTATGTNTTGPLTVTVTPQGTAPTIVSAPATVTSGAAFDVTVNAPAGTAPGTYTYAVKAEGSGASDTSTLTVTVQGAASGPAFGSLVISQVYGGGGNNSAPYRSDFVELFNRGTQSVSLSGLSLQYTSATGSFTGTPFALPAATLQPGQYYLVKMADGANTAAPALSPDASGTFAMSGTAGKIALVNNADAITGAADADVIDFVGFGGANEREGAAATPAPSNTASIFRKLNGCQDTNQNGNDFVTGAPAPRNSASPLNVCN
ncbi:putative extracellular nuclease [Deinococcus sp. HSC-46F16]|uniref:ExeM/NucH family extracellular endonuclease n=1 Tax=Deinococcus sp. HSC-46F16 TaxID=2910968 RepID=UPI00209DD791|nr:ExeM/NucH family extracellular endonuclease [Deinococcus sp. HSC-46F16]MCP2013321.1 putative extracellular nuclease [Deinococcus sp. HSC-46F16]